MKKLISILSTVAFILCSSVFVVSAAEPYDSYERPTIEDARTVAENYVGVGGIDENISPPGSDLNRLEVREIIPTMFVRQMLGNSYTPAQVAEETLGYTAIVWSGGKPITLLRIEKTDDRPLHIGVATAGGVSDFLDGLARMRERTVSGDVCVISMYGIVNYYFYTETADGPMTMPMTVYEDAQIKFGPYYSNELLIPFNEFESAYTEYLNFLDTTPPDKIPMGGGAIFEYLPPAKTMAAVKTWTPIVIGIIVAGCCCAMFCVLLERSRKKNLMQ